MTMAREAPEQSIRVILCRVVTIAVRNHGRFKFNSIPTYIVTTQIRTAIPQRHEKSQGFKNTW